MLVKVTEKCWQSLHPIDLQQIIFWWGKKPRMNWSCIIKLKWTKKNKQKPSLTQSASKLGLAPRFLHSVELTVLPSCPCLAHISCNSEVCCLIQRRILQSEVKRHSDVVAREREPFRWQDNYKAFLNINVFLLLPSACRPLTLGINNSLNSAVIALDSSKI